MVPVGMNLPPCARSLELLADLLEGDLDYYEVTPETLWRGPGAPVPNGYWRLFRDLARQTGRPVVAHGVGLSLGSHGPGQAHLQRIAQDHQQFCFAWYTDHLGASVLDGLNLGLPTPTPMGPTALATLRRRLRQLQRVVPDVGVENTCNYAVLGDPMAEPAFLRAALDQPGMWLLLDLHNVYTQALNLGFDPMDWLARAPLDRVIEIHVSGGSESDPAWLPEGRTLRLDSHDHGVPEPVWDLLERGLPRVPRLRGITLERLEDTVAPAAVPALAEELRRLREIARSRPTPSVAPTPPPPTDDAAQETLSTQGWEPALAAAWRSPDVVAAFAALAQDPAQPEDLRAACAAAEPDGLRISALLIAKLRFGRLSSGSREALAEFNADGPAFAARFARYLEAVPPTAFNPQDEAVLWAEWAGRGG